MRIATASYSRVAVPRTFARHEVFICADFSTNVQNAQLTLCHIWHILARVTDKPLVWLHGQIKTPPFSSAARIQAGYWLRRLQLGDHVGLPHSRPMPSIGVRCHELRITDKGKSWRIVYRIDEDAILILAVFEKQTQRTPAHILAVCRQRLRDYDTA
jgi:phage-related protein